MRNAMVVGDERRILHDFFIWRSDAHSLEDLGAYRTVERNLIREDARPSTDHRCGDHGIGIPSRACAAAAGSGAARRR